MSHEGKQQMAEIVSHLSIVHKKKISFHIFFTFDLLDRNRGGSGYASPTQEPDGHVDHGGGVLGRRGGGLQEGLQGGAPSIHHVEVGLRLRKVRLALLRGEERPLPVTRLLLQHPVRLVPGRSNVTGLRS